MDYKPTPGTTPYRVIELLQARGELSTSAICAELDMLNSTLPSFMKTAVAYGAVVVEKRDGLNFWRIGDGTPPSAPVPEEAPPPASVGMVDESIPCPIPEPHRYHRQLEQYESPAALAAEQLRRIGFPVRSGKHTICKNTVLFVRGTAASFVFRYTNTAGQRREKGLGTFVAYTRESAIEAIAAAIRASELLQAEINAGRDPLDDEQPEAAPAPGPDARPVRCAMWSDGSMSIERGVERIEFTQEQARVIRNYFSG